MKRLAPCQPPRGTRRGRRRAQGFNGRDGDGFATPLRGFPRTDSFDGSFNFCRGMYDSDRREAGGMGWWTDYPDADINFSIRLSELTKTRVSKQSTASRTTSSCG